MAPEVCPNCGAEVPPHARSCPECGSDEETGWSDEAYASNLGLPDDQFDYDEFTKREFGTKSPVPHGLHWWWWVVGIGLLTALLFLWFR